MKKRKVIITMMVLTLSTTLITGCGKTAKLKVKEDTVVAVKGGKITANSLYKELKKDSVKTLIDMMDHKLLDKKYPETEEEKESIENQISQIKSYYKDNEENYLAAIQSYFGVKNEEELKKTLSLEYKRGVAVNDYIKKNIKEEEINKYYEENIYGDIKASHILIAVNTKDDMTDQEKDKVKEKALKKAKDIIEKLNNGEDFKKLAKKYSDDGTNAKNGGDLGYFNKDDMDPSFWSAAVQLEKNKYSEEPVESAYGYHIILKTGEKKKKKLKDVKDSIKETLTKEKLSNDSSLYYQTLVDFRKSKNITFGDSYLEKEYNKYMDNLIENAKNNTNTQ